MDEEGIKETNNFDDLKNSLLRRKPGFPSFRDLFKEYRGKYIALRSPCHLDEIISFGEDNEEVHQRAYDKGIKTPFVVYIDEEDSCPFS